MDNLKHLKSSREATIFDRRGGSGRNRVLSLDATFDLHRQLQQHFGDPEKLVRYLAAANHMLDQSGVVFEKASKHRIGITALQLNADSFAVVTKTAEQIFQLVERAIDWVLADKDRITRYANDHQRIFPYLGKSAGTRHWQIISRYDALITPEGDMKIIELNTGAPAGFMKVDILSKTTAQFMGGLNDFFSGEHLKRASLGTPDPDRVIAELLRIEAESGLPKADIGLLYDEGQLGLELDLYKKGFERHGRRAHIAYAGGLTYKNGALMLAEHALSMTYNKFRISTQGSQRIEGWKPGFAERYHAFLTAHREQAFVPANNLLALTLPEDKSFLQVFFDEEFRATLSAEDLRLIDKHMLWTKKLEDTAVSFYGRDVKLLELVRSLKHRLVIKPANESRGYRVFIGRYCNGSQWDEAIASHNGPEPMVVQEYIQPIVLPVLHHEDGMARTDLMFHILSLAMVNGKFQGIISRLSSDPVGNVATGGCGQAVFVDHRTPAQIAET